MYPSNPSAHPQQSSHPGYSPAHQYPVQHVIREPVYIPVPVRSEQYYQPSSQQRPIQPSHIFHQQPPAYQVHHQAPRYAPQMPPQAHQIRFEQGPSMHPAYQGPPQQYAVSRQLQYQGESQPHYIRYHQPQGPNHQGPNQGHQGHALQQPHQQQHPNGRESSDPNYYDSMFNSKTREEDRTNKTAGSRNVFDYNMFSPKFQNHDMTWQQQQPHQPSHLEPTKRDQQNIFPSRAPERRPAPMQQQQQPNSSHPMQNRTISPGYQTAEQRVEEFNRTVDSMHVPDDIQRPLASRDYARSALDNGRDDTPNNQMIDRQFSFETFTNGSGSLPLTGGGSFEDMFYT